MGLELDHNLERLLHKARKPWEFKLLDEWLEKASGRDSQDVVLLKKFPAV